ncbi:hypothetical protein CEXT_685031 [Caerostris extrusa]|uniref:Uncharacterized protein n=1 Tax=Caerostris extrusa TaxID=172846 RepID=A0AAV4V0H5_CAEEX|nr:hypothetical protein CEXT_685031 [Caerostris extrusa]
MLFCCTIEESGFFVVMEKTAVLRYSDDANDPTAFWHLLCLSMNANDLQKQNICSPFNQGRAFLDKVANSRTLWRRM